MPAKNTTKIYIENGYYHVYNRGVEKRDIFLDNQDYSSLLYLLKYYLIPPRIDDRKQNKKSLNKEIKLLAFCLMPNHYHLLIKQFSSTGMTKLLRAIWTNYVAYFNEKYNRVGGLFQGKYKAALVDNEMYLIHLTSYIHQNPRELNRVGPWSGSDPLQNYPYSSYAYYLESKTADWIDANEILSYFRSPKNIYSRDYLSYESFVEGFPKDSKGLLENIALD
ncbi:transposase [Candidatus Gottesmanbacteria bacterium]|nr:transposase [Candidatus Gottesmanbacteria bacterium]